MSVNTKIYSGSMEQFFFKPVIDDKRNMIIWNINRAGDILLFINGIPPYLKGQDIELYKYMMINNKRIPEKIEHKVVINKYGIFQMGLNLNAFPGLSFTIEIEKDRINGEIPKLGFYFGFNK